MYFIRPGDKVRIYRESTRKWNWTYELNKVSNKIISVTDRIKVKEFNIASILHMTPHTNESDLKHYVENIAKNGKYWVPETEF